MLEAATPSTASPTEVWTGLVAGGITHAISGLSEMVGTQVRTTFISPRALDAVHLYEVVGDPESTMVAIHLGVTGKATGHILVLFQPETAFDLVDLLMDQPPGTTSSLDEMTVSVMGEMGNIMGAYFLTALSDNTGAALMPSPPTVLMDMAGAVLDAAVADVLLDSDELLLVETRFGTSDKQIRGVFLILPNPQLKEILLMEL